MPLEVLLPGLRSGISATCVGSLGTCSTKSTAAKVVAPDLVSTVFRSREHCCARQP